MISRRHCDTICTVTGVSASGESGSSVTPTCTRWPSSSVYQRSGTKAGGFAIAWSTGLSAVSTIHTSGIANTAAPMRSRA
ncbi:hypothetical protein OT109_18410 [Phycisphaeraceae bacterium D3-23]